MTATKQPATDGTELVELAELRAELAFRLGVEVEVLRDGSELSAAGGFDSLALMTVLAWADERQLLLPDDQLPATVGELLRLGQRRASIPRYRITGARGSAHPDIDRFGPGDLPLTAQQDLSPLAPVLATHRWALTPVRPEDVGFLYMLATRPDAGFRWRYRSVAPPVEQFQQDLWTSVLAQHVVRIRSSNEPVGHVVAYAADHIQGRVHLGAVFLPEVAGSGRAAEAVSLFVDYIFHTLPMRVIYLDIPGYNWPQLSSAAGRLFDVEGILRDHDYYAGRYWDQYICAIHRPGQPDSTAPLSTLPQQPNQP